MTALRVYRVCERCGMLIMAVAFPARCPGCAHENRDVA